ncbi:dihydrolipoyllysine-residue acetyltransferase [Methyloversatilis sp.]|uniref:dihydrolipoyllysine-residue acetyltransferase n=1 Tax=Methyloversatilis sp. TaxID=2569862 RepID=UPI002735DD8E|nr:dihydrolipoyllysine-residue acetyltransferase [Methyloversatilis sp.]MDP2868678.1 dihydrolipoyllysine-residue acetyltransferase [Methyloversatilis sp.]MDP3455728.1 dihydrolipoyllysine-residue acetyltransferase [Methyloversatilis sp.]MDP3579199.1 dihydrolipoyllysine-residue acetyltransferase [Methyloversatilis sp.]
MSTINIEVPDIGDFADVPVIEVLVKPGDRVALDAPLVTLESDKATMDIPAPAAGVIGQITVKVGDRVSQGATIGTMEAGAPEAATASVTAPTAGVAAQPVAPPPVMAVATAAPAATGQSTPGDSKPAAADAAAQRLGGSKAHASPSIRAYARELGVDLSRVAASGPKNRIMREDINAFVKGALQAPAAAPAATGGGSGLDLLPWPKVDFTKFGDIERKPLSRIRKLSAANLSRNWVMIPAVTYHEDADVTDLEAFRQQINAEQAKGGVKLTMLAFIIKAVCSALKKFPDFNSSIDLQAEEPALILKQYCHIGFAADTPGGLMVPVIRDADKKGAAQLAAECGELAAKARDGKLSAAEMQGACFTISSVGGLGGTGFAPIINAPEVAILGVSRTTMKPVWDGSAFQPRLILPLSLTADHRVVDGAAATRFNAHVAALLADMRRALM